ncbi:MAG: carbon starvation protein A [Clostridiales bacterium]|nr:carbon starvation protein A [Clostridiales bacterium]
MSAILLIVVAAALLLVAYIVYGGWLARRWGIDAKNIAPSHAKEDGVDFVPTAKQILIGHHFSSIAGAGPITGPIQAAVFGWVPVFLWIMVGGIFFGGVHDYGALVASMRHEGKSIGEVIHANMGKKGKTLFSLFSFLTLILVVAAFTDVVATTFINSAAAGISSMLFILIAIAFGIAVYRKGVPIGIATVIGLVLMGLAIYLGLTLQNVIVLPKIAWVIILIIYIAIASTAPVWILLQPRDYLNSFLLYSMIAGAFVGIILARPTLQLPAFTEFKLSQYNMLFPMLFVTVACGAISGFHSLVSSGTTSKQIDNEKDAKLIGYGSMLIESLLAVISLIAAAVLTREGLANGGSPINIFANGCANFMNAFGLPVDVGVIFVSLAISAFALTSLDTATRLARFVFQEFFSKGEVGTESAVDESNLLTNKYFATLITVVLGGGLALKGYQVVWPIFGSANQLLAALALMAVAVWLRRDGKGYNMILIPMAFMFAVCLSALVLVFMSNLAKGGYIMVVISAILFALAIVLLIEGIKIFTDPNTKGQRLKAQN